MICPYCGKEMRQGYISCRDGVYWSEKMHILPTALGFGKDEKIDLNTQAHNVIAYNCDNCKKVIIDYSD